MCPRVGTGVKASEGAKVVHKRPHTIHLTLSCTDTHCQVCEFVADDSVGMLIQTLRCRLFGMALRDAAGRGAFDRQDCLRPRRCREAEREPV